MKIIYNNIIPFPGYVAMNLFGVLFVRKKFKGKLTNDTIRHETIHSLQQRELLYVGFYLWYIVEWLIRVLFTKDRFSHQAYRHISFEQEAYDWEGFTAYLETREKYAWMRYLKQKIV